MEYTKKELGKKVLETAYLTGHFVLRSGKTSNYYLDKYLFETQPEILKAIAREMGKMLPAGQYDRLAGPELGAIALVTAVGMEVNSPFLFVKKATKGYGTDKLIEGKFNKGERIIIIEDILTTGGASLEAAKTLQAAGLKVECIIGVIDREQGAQQTVTEAGFKLMSLFTKTELGI